VRKNIKQKGVECVNISQVGSSPSSQAVQKTPSQPIKQKQELDVLAGGSSPKNAKPNSQGLGEQIDIKV